jgi:hypothetical protein
MGLAGPSLSAPDLKMFVCFWVLLADEINARLLCLIGRANEIEFEDTSLNGLVPRHEVVQSGVTN